MRKVKIYGLKQLNRTDLSLLHCLKFKHNKHCFYAELDTQTALRLVAWFKDYDGVRVIF